MAVARVVEFDGVTSERLEQMKQEMQGSAPPEGVPVKELIVLHDAEAEKAIVVLFFDSDEDYRQGDEALNAMPADETPGRRASVQKYEVVVRDPKSEMLAKVVGDGQASAAAAEVRAPIPGLITKVLLKAGDAVKKDQPVLCLDAMKLENEIAAPKDGVVKSVEVQPGQAVEKGQSLFVIG